MSALISSTSTSAEKDDSVPSIWQPPAQIEGLYASTEGNVWAQINSPKAGARVEEALPVGDAPIQFYSLGTPNGKKPAIILEELALEGLLTYDAHRVGLGGDQFKSGFVGVNPNSKIPALVDLKGPGDQPLNVFESGSIVLYLAEKYNRFIPADPRLKAECLNWVFWQMGGQGPITGQFGHFFVYAPDDKKETRDYGTARYGMEVQRLCDVLDKQLDGKEYLVGGEYSIADIMNFPWFYQLQHGYPHKSGIKAAEFLNVSQYKNLVAWSERINKRPAVQTAHKVTPF